MGTSAHFLIFLPVYIFFFFRKRHVFDVFATDETNVIRIRNKEVPGFWVSLACTHECVLEAPRYIWVPKMSPWAQGGYYHKHAEQSKFKIEAASEIAQDFYADWPELAEI